MTVKFKISTLNKCNKIAATMNPKRYMSVDGAKLLEIIRLLLPESGGQPGAVCAKIAQIGRLYKWDMPRIPATGEASFLLWLVMEVAQTAAAVPIPVAPTAPAPGRPSVPDNSRRRR